MYIMYRITYIRVVLECTLLYLDAGRPYREFALNRRVKSFRCNFSLFFVVVADYRGPRKLKSVLRIVNGHLRLPLQHLSVGPPGLSKV